MSVVAQKAAGESQATVDALKKAGGSPKLTIYSKAGHDSWTAFCDDPKSYEGLLEQRRRSGDKATRRD